MFAEIIGNMLNLLYQRESTRKNLPVGCGVTCISTAKRKFK